MRYLLSGDREYLRNSTLAVETVWRLHGQASGIYSAEDNLAGREPSKGTETCTVNEAMFSLFSAGLQTFWAENGFSRYEIVRVRTGCVVLVEKVRYLYTPFQ